MEQSKICLLLTGTIAPPHVPNLKRSIPAERENDYLKAIEQWLKLGYRVVFVENSGYESKQIAALTESHELEFLQFQTQKSHLGKGAGEAEILEYAFARSAVLRESETVLKVTGRYFVGNARSIVEAAPVGDSIWVSAILKQYLTFADSRFFIFRNEFYSHYLKAALAQVDETAGIYFEHGLARAIHACLADGHSWRPLPEYPVFEGYYGTENTRIKNDLLRRWKRKLVLSAANFLTRIDY